MLMKLINHFTLGVRVANFSNSNPPVGHILDFESSDAESIVKQIRRYADLPYVFVIDKENANLIPEVLSKLQAIQSACYPYALFVIDDPDLMVDESELDIIPIKSSEISTLHERIDEYAASRFMFKNEKLRIGNAEAIPEKVEVVIVGAGITGIYAANQLMRNGISFCVLEKREKVGGIWSMYANTTSRVNSSECAYRLVENKTRSNRDHSATREILEDIAELAEHVSNDIFLDTEVGQIKKIGSHYQTAYTRGEKDSAIESKGVILAINDRVGVPRDIEWENQGLFQGEIVTGISDQAREVDWRNKDVVIAGMGAFAVENARTALEGGANHVTVVCRRHGTICPKIIDYLNFATPYDENFSHDKKSNIRNMMYWKKLYDQSGATHPECWMGKIKHEGHTISVSDIWFISHYLKRTKTVTGSISAMYENGVVVDGHQKIDADIVVPCIGFERNTSVAKELCGYHEMYNNNYVDKDFMYLADAFIDDDAFNSFFGSSVLEMAKFYMNVFIRFFDSSQFDEMMNTEGIEKIPIENRKWSHYIAAAEALIQDHPDLYKMAMDQVTKRTKNFLEKHDLETYIAENKREWIDTHAMLAGKPMDEADCLPYVFEKLLPKRK